MTNEEIDWVAVRADYEAKEKPLYVLCAEHGIGRRRLYTRLEAEGWKRRMAVRPGTRRSLIGRMYRLLERQIAQLENEMTEPSDKEAAILGSLTRNLEKLIELDNKENGRTDNASKRTDIEALRKKLAVRLESLRKR